MGWIFNGMGRPRDRNHEELQKQSDSTSDLQTEKYTSLTEHSSDTH